MSEARLPRELLFGYASDVVDESAVRFIQLLHYLGEREALFLFRHPGLLKSLQKLLFIHGLGFAQGRTCSRAARRALQ